MIDRYLLPVIKSSLDPAAQAIAARGISANQVTWVGFFIGLLALPSIATGHYALGLLFILVNRLFDGLDGAIARQRGATDQGAFLDISLDFAFYASIPLAFAFAMPQNALPAAFLLASFIGTGTSFLAFSVLAERRGMSSIHYPNKGIYYLGGLTEGFETILVFVIACLWPKYFPTIAYIFGTACLLTAALRIYYGYKSFAEGSEK